MDRVLLFTFILFLPLTAFSNEIIMTEPENPDEFVFVCSSKEAPDARVIAISELKVKADSCKPMLEKWNRIIDEGYEQGRLFMSGSTDCKYWPGQPTKYFSATYVLRPRTENDIEYFREYMANIEKVDFLGTPLKFKSLKGCYERFGVDSYSSNTRIRSDKRDIFYEVYGEYLNDIEKFSRNFSERLIDTFIEVLRIKLGNWVPETYRNNVLPYSNYMTFISQIDYLLEDNSRIRSGFGKTGTRLCKRTCAEE